MRNWWKREEWKVSCYLHVPPVREERVLSSVMHPEARGILLEHIYRRPPPSPPPPPQPTTTTKTPYPHCRQSRLVIHISGIFISFRFVFYSIN